MTVHFHEAAGDADAVVVRPLTNPVRGIYARGLKRILDVGLVLLTSPLVLAIVAVVAAAIYVSDRQSPFYTQTRVGKSGRRFMLWKLRSMVPNADLLLEEYLAANPSAKAEWDKHQKLEHDPRITPIGRFIRKTSIDELPQLWNVLIGDMSLVGPRPMMVKQVELYPGHRYYTMRPGITGLWQVSDRNDCTFRKRAQFDETYGRNLSFGLDMMIMLRTVLVMMRCTGR